MSLAKNATALLSKLPDQTAAFLADGYLFQERLRKAEGRSPGDARPLATRLLGRPALIVRGKEGVDLFYDTSRMKRDGAMPLPVRGPLFGKGAVHGLDDEEHRHRKAMLMRITYDDAQVRRFMPILEDEMRKTLARWEQEPGTVYDGSVITYGRAALRWAGVPGSEEELDTWAQRLGQIVEGFGRKSPAHVEAWINRRRCDAWAADLVARTRRGEITPEPGTALHEVANATNLDGSPLDEHTAGVELQNTTRPTIAVARFAAFAARALVEHPEYRERIADEVASSGTLLENPTAVAFAQEVRRVSPFVPMLPAFARDSFEWGGQKIRRGQRVLIDILGTNNDPHEWDSPEEFRPERFTGVDAEKIQSFIPQGGGDVATGHRCPGEKIAVTALSVTVAGLCTPGVEIDPKGLDFKWTQLPTLPGSGARVRVKRA
ncbi:MULTISPECIES: cytochrome P450 [Dermacoccus]|uniref:cytochrome P450 n=1 Tax=Dermacoccus TaxID=57495 RepID=UPI001CA6DF9A|nr:MULTISPECIES: cytochrome P450 [Dermacoccus]MBZ4498576.1 cytochrome P450 [Dermacoccus sp. Tok2021]MCT1987242.1 cytochrome P450 [Dermacoccus abyssi]